MIKHFTKLQTPLQSISRYPTISAQEERFIGTRWPLVSVWSLWDLWCNTEFLTSQQRTLLDSIESFDEWEEFALFACHYFLLVASNSMTATPNCHGWIRLSKPVLSAAISSYTATVDGFCVQRPTIMLTATAAASEHFRRRRYGILYQSQQHEFAHHGGLGIQGRLNSTDFYSATSNNLAEQNTPELVVEARLCHTVTRTTTHRGYLMVGGRVSPTRALADCWLQHEEGTWHRDESLPTPLYRHSAVLVTNGDGAHGVLVYGGKSTDNVVIGQWLLWRKRFGWVRLKVNGPVVAPRFGASMVVTQPLNVGILIGGIGSDGTIICEIWEWRIEFTDESLGAQVWVQQMTSDILHIVCRFSASILHTRWGIVLAGGITSNGLPLKGYDVCILATPDFKDSVRKVETRISMNEAMPIETPESMLLGHSVFWHEDRQSLSIIGGGGVCFSFGVYWNNGLIIQRRAPEAKNVSTFMRLKEKYVQPNQSDILCAESVTNCSQTSRSGSNKPTPIARQRLIGSISFHNIVDHSKPLIVEELELGPCTAKWTTHYLREKVGPERRVCFPACWPIFDFLI